MVQNGTETPENGTPLRAFTGWSYGSGNKMERNGTKFPKNGTAFRTITLAAQNGTKGNGTLQKRNARTHSPESTFPRRSKQKSVLCTFMHLDSLSPVNVNPTANQTINSAF
jgi:hypothetical protein